MSEIAKTLRQELSDLIKYGDDIDSVPVKANQGHIHKAIMRIDYLGARLDRRDKRIAELEELLTKIAGVVHHGGLLNLNEPAETTVRRLTLNFWDRDECDRIRDALEMSDE